MLKRRTKIFFVGHVDQVIESTTTDIEVDTKDKIQQPHLDNSEIKNTEWKDLY